MTCFGKNDELLSLLSKEKQTPFNPQDESLMEARKLAIDWVLRVCSHYGFTGLTVILAVNYFNRFISSLCIQKDKTWMSQLAAVACLSLIAKVVETQVPLLIDFQVEESKFMFDSRSIMRMELLVLSSLEWKMSLVTPFSFIDHIIRRLGLKTYPHLEFLIRCERLFLSVINEHQRSSKMMMSLVSISPPFYAPWKSKAIVLEKFVSPINRGSFGVKAFFFNPPDEPILKEALKVAAEKPNPMIFLRACELLDLKPEDAVHVGDDRRNDIWGARDAGCDAWL